VSAGSIMLRAEVRGSAQTFSTWPTKSHHPDLIRGRIRIKLLLTRSGESEEDLRSESETSKLTKLVFWLFSDNLILARRQCRLRC